METDLRVGNFPMETRCERIKYQGQLQAVVMFGTPK
jgi:hypothetical protein